MLHNASESSSLCVQLEQLTAVFSLVPPPVFAAFPCVFPPQSTGSCCGRLAGLTTRMNFLLLLWHCSLCCVQTRVTTPTGGEVLGLMSNPLKFPSWEGDSVQKVASAPYLLMFLILQHGIIPLISQRKKIASTGVMNIVFPALLQRQQSGESLCCCKCKWC